MSNPFDRNRTKEAKLGQLITEPGEQNQRDAVHIAVVPVKARNSRAVIDVIDERLRQVGHEGWTPEHDDEHGDGSMAIAAACYALPPGMRQMTELSVPWGWPWSSEWWKPKGRRKDLMRAAALLLAEIERLDRHQQLMDEGRAIENENRPRQGE